MNRLVRDAALARIRRVVRGLSVHIDEEMTVRVELEEEVGKVDEQEDNGAPVRDTQDEGELGALG